MSYRPPAARGYCLGMLTVLGLVVSTISKRGERDGALRTE